MSYFGFLLRYLVIPISLLFVALGWGANRKRRGETVRVRPSALAAILSHVLIAVVYTTPWDNYLVATSVWWYDRALVSGVTIGWVPIEEYTFFVLQPILGGLWLLFLQRRLPAAAEPLRNNLRRRLIWPAALLWLVAGMLLLVGPKSGTYLSLELIWALPPLALQLLFGADILWRRRRLLLVTIAPLTLYLSAADALAIGSGTWTINPAQSLNIFVGGILPLEELLFFLLTNTLLAFGLTLILSKTSHSRLRALIQAWSSSRAIRSDAGSN